jgi:hypothetical protein
LTYAEPGTLAALGMTGGMSRGRNAVIPRSGATRDPVLG